MKDIISINRQFLIMAREAAKLNSGEVVTGLQRSVLDRIGKLSLDEIETIAQNVSVSLVSFRLNDNELARLISLSDKQKKAYSASVAAREGGDGRAG
jgi:hypothetical protein